LRGGGADEASHPAARRDGLLRSARNDAFWAARISTALALACLILLTFQARAVEPAERLADPVLEARARAISKELRCLVCQNEAIDDSNADLAHDIRVLLRERIKDGDTDRQAIQFLVDRYGDFILLKPPVEPVTYVLWFGPPLVLAIALGGIALHVRRRRATGEDVPVPLTEDERRRLAAMLRDGEG
jgi:cytochrome c-type biogenesis protein CcmH